MNSPQMVDRPELNTITAGLAATRSRLRRLFGLYGGTCLFGAALAVLMIAFLLDRFLNLPRPVRVVELLLALGALGYGIWRFLVYPLTRPVRLEDMALAVENRFRSLDGRLISALELSREPDLEKRNLSPELVSRLLKDTAAQTSSIPFEDIFWHRRLRQVGLVAGLLALIALVYSALSPTDVRVFLSRFFASSREWPRRTYLVIDVPRDNPNYTVETEESGGHTRHHVLVARGASLPIKVVAKGHQPADVFLVARDEESGVREFEMLKRENEFSYRMRAVRKPMTLTVHGGDDDGTGRDVEVKVRTAPLVSKAEAMLKPPAYTGLTERTTPDGHVDAPAGTQAKVRFQFNVPLRAAEAAIDGKTVSLPLDPDGNAATLDFVVKDSGSYTLSLTGKDGFSNLDPISYTIVAAKDKPPVAKPLDPARSELEVTPTAEVLLRAQFLDDYGISEVRLKHQLMGANQVGEENPVDAGRCDPLPGKDVIASFAWDLQNMDVAADDGARRCRPGDAIVYSWIVRDNGTDAEGNPTPNELTVKDRRINIVSETEKLRLLTERQVRLKEDVKAVRALQEEKLGTLKTLIESGTGDDEISTPELVSVEVGQNQVTQRARRLSREFADIFEEYLFNRLDRSTPAERLLLLHLENRRTLRGEEGFQPALFDGLLESYRRGDYGDLGVLAKLLAMIDLSFAVSEKLSPQAYESLSAARVTARRSDRPDLIATAFKAQGQVVENLDHLLQKMDEWEDFQEILELMREVIDDQRGLNRRFRDELKVKEEQGK